MKRFFAILLAFLCLTACAAPAQPPAAPAEDTIPDSSYLAPVTPEEQLEADKEWVDEVYDYFPAPEPATDVPPEERIPLSIAGVCVEQGFNMIVENFNRSNPRYYVTLTDYAWNAENSKQGLTVLQTKLMSGQFPDMLYFSHNNGEDSLYNETLLSPLPFISKGLLLDLDPFLEADPNIQKEDIIGWNGLHEYGGLYLLSPRMRVSTLQASQEVFGDRTGWTIDEYLEKQANLKERQHMNYYSDPRYFLEAVGGRYVRDTVDLENAVCDFNNPAFISILNGAAQAEDYQYANDPDSFGETFKHAIQLLEDQDILVASGSSEPQWIAFDRQFASEDARFTYIGWPTVDGSCGSDLELTFPIGVCANTEQAQGCWEFLKFVLQHPITSGDNAPIATYAPVFSEDKKVFNSQRDNRHPMIQSDFDTARALADQCEHMTFYDEAVLRIILEEAEWFLKGDATAEDTAAKIQSRASLYLSEQYG